MLGFYALSEQPLSESAVVAEGVVGTVGIADETNVAPSIVVRIAGRVAVGTADEISTAIPILVNSQGPRSLTAQDLEDIVDAIFTRIIENGETFEQQLRLIRAEAAGHLTVSGNQVGIRDAANTKDRITATTDINGQRTVVVTDPD